LRNACCRQGYPPVKQGQSCCHTQEHDFAKQCSTHIKQGSVLATQTGMCVQGKGMHITDKAVIPPDKRHPLVTQTGMHVQDKGMLITDKETFLPHRWDPLRGKGNAFPIQEHLVAKWRGCLCYARGSFCHTRGNACASQGNAVYRQGSFLAMRRRSHSQPKGNTGARQKNACHMQGSFLAKQIQSYSQTKLNASARQGMLVLDKDILPSAKDNHRTR
jgi:hypothetical protein